MLQDCQLLLGGVTLPAHQHHHYMNEDIHDKVSYQLSAAQGRKRRNAYNAARRRKGNYEMGKELDDT